LLCYYRTVCLFIWKEDHCAASQQETHRRRGSGNDQYALMSPDAKAGLDAVSDGPTIFVYYLLQIKFYYAGKK